MMANEVVAAIIDALNQLNVPFMLVGSFSSNMYGSPRSTNDADFVVQLDPRLFTPLMSGLGTDFDIDPQMSFETITSTTRYRLRHKATTFLIELFELSPDPHDQVRFSRRVATKFLGRDAFVAAPEDVVITKLRWSRHGHRAKDLEDVQGVIAIQWGKLDLPYIRHWCDQHGTREVLERLLLETERRI